MYNERNLNKGILFAMLIALLCSLLGSFKSGRQDTAKSTKVVEVTKSDADIQREIAWARQILNGPTCHYGFHFMEQARSILEKYNEPLVKDYQYSVVNVNTAPNVSTKPSYIQKASFTEK